MKLTRVCSLIAAAVLLSAAALAQTDGAPSPTPGLPAAPSSAGASTATLGTNATGSKIGAINVEQAIFASNEGQRDFDVLSKKLEPKQTDLKSKNDEIEALKKQLNTQGDKMNDEAKANLQRQVEQKQKALERSAQDAQEDARNQENEIAQRILQKMAPLIVKYASDNGFGMIIDTSTNNQWPNGPVLWSGIAPPPPRQGGATGATGARPSGAGTSKPTAPATKSAAPGTSKPQTTTTTPPSK
jgi:outer membrane protein